MFQYKYCPLTYNSTWVLEASMLPLRPLTKIHNVLFNLLQPGVAYLYPLKTGFIDKQHQTLMGLWELLIFTTTDGIINLK